jgi:hypothetical protein
VTTDLNPGGSVSVNTTFVAGIGPLLPTVTMNAAVPPAVTTGASATSVTATSVTATSAGWSTWAAATEVLCARR